MAGSERNTSQRSKKLLYLFDFDGSTFLRKSNLSMNAQAAVAGEKRGRGRPKGSVNKVKSDADKSTEKKGRGRPKGTAKKATAEKKSETGEKKGRGRPKGSKNKARAW
eukprot:scaffold477371_cov40-Prasinocladus_malaysianus.AAC.1